MNEENELHGQYVWVEGMIAHGQQPKDFPKRARIYVHGIGTGTPKKYKLVTESDAAQPSEAATVSVGQCAGLRELVADWRKLGETPWGGGKYNRCADDLESWLVKAQPPTPNAGEVRLDTEAHKWLAMTTPRPEIVAVSPTTWGVKHNGAMVCAPTIQEAVEVTMRALAASTPAAKEADAVLLAKLEMELNSKGGGRMSFRTIRNRQCEHKENLVRCKKKKAVKVHGVYVCPRHAKMYRIARKMGACHKPLLQYDEKMKLIGNLRCDQGWECKQLADLQRQLKEAEEGRLKMSRTITTSLGVFNYVTDKKHSWFLWRCSCGEIATLTEDSLIKTCLCKTPKVDDLWRTLIATMQVRRLDGEKPEDFYPNWSMPMSSTI